MSDTRPWDINRYAEELKIRNAKAAELQREVEEVKLQCQRDVETTTLEYDGQLKLLLAERDTLKREVGEAYALMQSGDIDAAFDVLKSLAGQGE